MNMFICNTKVNPVICSTPLDKQCLWWQLIPWFSHKTDFILISQNHIHVIVSVKHLMNTVVFVIQCFNKDTQNWTAVLQVLYYHYILNFKTHLEIFKVFIQLQQQFSNVCMLFWTKWSLWNSSMWTANRIFATQTSKCKGFTYIFIYGLFNDAVSSSEYTV